LIELHNDFKPVARADSLLRTRARRTPQQSAAQCPCGVGSSPGADAAAQQATCKATNHGPTGISAFDFDWADGGDSAALDILRLACF